MTETHQGQRTQERLEGLSATGRTLLAEATAALQRRDGPTLAQRSTALRALAPHHPEVLRLLAAIANLQGRRDEAIRLLREVVAQRPDDATASTDLGHALAAHGDLDEALAQLRRCVELEPTRQAHRLALAHLLEQANDFETAVATLRAALAQEPTHAPARVALARLLFALGHGVDAAVEYRRVLAQAPGTPAAWYGLSTLRDPAFTDADVAAMQRLLARPDLPDAARASTGFALAHASEALQQRDAAWSALVDANALWRKRQHWDAQKMSRHVAAILEVFDGAESAVEPQRGDGLVFIVGLPRSGSSIIEQILAAHPDVAAGGELEHVTAIVRTESERRQRDFPHWVADAREADWKRLGETYLARTHARREGRSVFTDKGLLNWLYLGALRRMLPGARFVDSRRDPLETCLACWRQMFVRELGFTYDLSDLARFWHDYDRAMRQWRRLHASSLLELRHERLVASPETEIRALLDFCGLRFEQRCLDFHSSGRAVRTLSADQVREPLRPRTPHAEFYGSHVDALRAMLNAGSDVR